MKSNHHVLLVNPWIEDFAAYDLWIRPVGLLKIARLFKDFGFKVSVIDCLERTTPRLKKLIKAQKGIDRGDGRGNFFKHILNKPSSVDFVPRYFGRYGIPLELFLTTIANLPEPDLICISTVMTYWYTGLDTITELIHDRWPTVPIVMGGPYPTFLPEHAKSRPFCKAIFQGSSLNTFSKYINELFVDHFKTRPKKPNIEADALEPDFTHLEDRSYLAIETSRGCPFRCSYCATKLHYQGFVQFPPEQIVSQLMTYQHRYATQHIAFYDDALFFNPEDHIKPILRLIKDQGLTFSFHTPNGLFPRYLDQELAELMIQTNFKTIRLSLDTISPIRQKALGKVNSADLRNAFDHLENAGYKRKMVEVYILVGLPDQNPDEIEQALMFVRELGGISRLAQFSPVPGTKDWHRVVEAGVIGSSADPLLQNPTVYAYLNPYLSFSTYEQLKQLSLEMNSQGVSKS